jgi:hypothetical protein
VKKNGHIKIKPKIDPIVRQAATTISFMSAKELQEGSGLARSTCYAILNGKTKRPQNLTIDLMLHAAGFERNIIRRT